MVIYEVKGNFWAIFFRSLLVGLGIGCFYLIYFLSSPLVSPILLLLGLYLIFMSIFIKTKEIKLDYEKFFIERHGYFKILNECREYKYRDIKSVEYVEGYFSTEKLFFAILLGILMRILTPLFRSRHGYFTGGFISKSDRMRIIKKDGTEEVIVRIGNREAFKKAIEIIKENIKDR